MTPAERNLLIVLAQAIAYTHPQPRRLDDAIQELKLEQLPKTEHPKFCACGTCMGKRA